MILTQTIAGRLQILIELVSPRKNDDGSFEPPLVQLSKEDILKLLEIACE